MLPTLNGIIDRRILINYKADPEIVKKLLPEGFNPLKVNGFASVGICLLRLKNIGFKYSPNFLRLNSENAAHRILVTWQSNGRTVEGVYIPRRDTDSLLNVLIPGKVLSWPHYLTDFTVQEDENNYYMEMKSRDLKSYVRVNANKTNAFPENSMFDSLNQASCCFEKCSVGYSPSSQADSLKGIYLKTENWSVEPLDVTDLESSFFDDRSLFPAGSVAFDNALLMRNIKHEWHESSVNKQAQQ